jgi:hypothetical protein
MDDESSRCSTGLADLFDACYSCFDRDSFCGLLDDTNEELRRFEGLVELVDQ